MVSSELGLEADYGVESDLTTAAGQATHADKSPKFCNM
jgi:hypothetical protein